MSQDIVKKEKSIKKFTFKGKNLEDLLALSKAGDGKGEVVSEGLAQLFRTRIRRKIDRGLSNKYATLIRKVVAKKKAAPPGEKPAPVKTHFRNMIIVPEMVGGVIGIYSGKEFTNVEIKFDMIGKYLGEFSITYKLTKHGKPGVGATKGSQHVDKK